MSKFSESIDDAYFTCPEDVDFAHKTLREHGWLDGTVLEPCAGAGRLVKGLDRVEMWDLNQYDVPLARVGDFLEQPADKRFDLVLTNPPFGWLGHLAGDIFNKATEFSDRVAIILPQCYRKVQRIDKLNRDWHPVGDFNLPKQEYILPDGETRKFVRTCFQMWERRDYKRKKFGNTSYQEFFRQVPKADAEYYLRTQGSTAGKILDGLAYPDGREYNSNTGRWMAGGKDLILQHNWLKVARFASGAQSIGLHDIAWGLRSPNTEEYLNHGIMYDLINGVYDEQPPTLEPHFVK